MTLTKTRKIQGMTLIEIIIFTVLLSLLIANTINYLYTIHTSNMKLMNEVEDAQQNSQQGFIATTAIILLALGTLAFLLATLSAITSYADSIEKREIRIQKNLNEHACAETLPLLIARNYFFEGDLKLNDLDCTVHR